VLKNTLFAAALATAATAVFGVNAFAGSSRATVTTLQGTVGPGYTIKLTQGGKQVKTLAPGTYRFVIADKAKIHNFQLERESGAHLERVLTTVPFTGTKTIQIKLTSGKWKFYCKPHEQTMVGEFTVG
jgi:plastocyanin